jgi:hypothetical protein
VTGDGSSESVVVRASRAMGFIVGGVEGRDGGDEEW